MAWKEIQKVINQFLSGVRKEEEEAGVSRRAVLSGLGLAGVIAAAGPTLLMSDDAEAEVINTQYGGRRRRRRGRGRGRGRRGRGRRGPPRRRRRISRSELRRRCRSRRYRRRNPRLCSYARGRRRRRGGCISIGPLTVCD